MIVRPDFLDHWKTQLLVRLLDDPCAPIYVIRLWGYCQSSKTHGFLPGNPEAIAGIARYPKDAKTLLEALLQTFVEPSEGGKYCCHDWEEVNSSLIASWENGEKGGRPPKKTHGKPTANRNETDKIREDKKECVYARVVVSPDPASNGRFDREGLQHTHGDILLRLPAALHSPSSVTQFAAWVQHRALKAKPTTTQQLLQVLKIIENTFETPTQLCEAAAKGIVNDWQNLTGPKS